MIESFAPVSIVTHTGNVVLIDPGSPSRSLIVLKNRPSDRKMPGSRDISAGKSDVADAADTWAFIVSIR